MPSDGAPGAPHRLLSAWKPGEAVWQGSIDGHPVAMQARPVPNGFRLGHQGFEVSINVFTESEAAAMLGGPRGLRRFALQFETHAQQAPFAVRIDVVAGVKRYVREGNG